MNAIIKKIFSLNGIFAKPNVLFNKKETISKNKKEKAGKRELLLKLFIIVPATFIIMGIISFLAMYFSLDYYYANRVFPSVYVLGNEVGGTNGNLLKDKLKKEVDETKINFKISGQEEYLGLSDIGVTAEVDKTVEIAKNQGRTGNFFEDAKFRSKAFLFLITPDVYANNVEIKSVDVPFDIDNAKMGGFVKNIIEKYKTPEKNAALVIKGTDIEVLPAQFGEQIISSSIEKQIKEVLTGVKAGKKLVVSVDSEKIAPKIQEEALSNSIGIAKTIINKKVKLTFEDKIYIPTKETVAGWIIFQEENNQLVPKIDQTKVEGYLNTIAYNIDIAALPKKIKIENGVKETVEEEGKDGRALLVSANAANIKSQLENESNNQVNVSLSVITVPPKVIRNEVVVANWDKYIDINLSTQTITAYLKDGVFVNSWKITSGKSGTPTPAGTWMIFGKTPITRMVGGTPGVDYYDLSNIHWVSWFKAGGFAIHEAWWRTSFGGADYVWSGSHGCINASYDTAKFIYDWAPIGTPVIVHY